MKLIFAGDPMCSWCYGFVPELKALAERHPGLPLTILVGGVRMMRASSSAWGTGPWSRKKAA
jgi:putative protein-disulfide isomerase